MQRALIPLFSLFALAAQPAPAQDVPLGPAAARGRAAEQPVPADHAGDLAGWSGWHVEHLLNRAGFGGDTAEVQAWAERKPEELVEHLLVGGQSGEAFPFERIMLDRRALLDATEDERRVATNRVRNAERNQLQDFVGWWLTQMVTGEDPLRERMVLFWHGHFASSVRTVKRGGMMIQQNLTFREHALGSFEELLNAMLRDPALLVFLDNNDNVKDSPNENLAREVMELFTLGEGNYSEDDVVAAARALTGYTVGEQEFLFRRRKHDRGEKRILGIKGRHDADDLAEILLAQSSCGRWIAGQLIAYFEGAPASPERIERYGALLQSHDYQVEPLLRALFLDPAFYRPEVVGAKVASPVDYVVGACRRLGIDPHGRVLSTSTSILGQTLMAPPNVKGWEGGMSWLTTASLMMRGNLAGALLGVVEPEDVLGDEEALALIEEQLDGAKGSMEAGMTMMSDETMSADDVMMELESEAELGIKATSIGRLLTTMKRRGYRPAVRLVDSLGEAVNGDDATLVAALCDQLLAIEAPAETLEMLSQSLKRERIELRLKAGSLGQHRRRGEYVLRRMAHLILSLPEAQLS